MVESYSSYPTRTTTLPKGGVADFEALYDSYSPALYGFIRQSVQDEKLASSILEKAFIQIWQLCQTQDCIKQRLFAWMYGICHKIIKEEIGQSPKSYSFSREYSSSFRQ